MTQLTNEQVVDLQAVMMDSILPRSIQEMIELVCAELLERRAKDAPLCELNGSCVKQRQHAGPCLSRRGRRLRAKP